MQTIDIAFASVAKIRMDIQSCHDSVDLFDRALEDCEKIVESMPRKKERA